jgi:hypothetical protein
VLCLKSNGSISETVRNRTHVHINFFLRMTDTKTSQSIVLSSWDTLYMGCALGTGECVGWCSAVGVRRGLCESYIEKFNCHMGCKSNGFSLHLWKGTTVKRQRWGSSVANRSADCLASCSGRPLQYRLTVILK